MTAWPVRALMLMMSRPPAYFPLVTTAPHSFSIFYPHCQDAMGPDALEKALGLEALRKHHKVHLFPGSVSEGTGYIEAFQWLENAMDSLDAQASGAASG